MPRSKLELAMLEQLTEAGLLDGMVEEHAFHEERRWRWDFAWPEHKVALEVHGGLYTRGRHIRPRGMLNDMEKSSEGAIMGWRLITVSGVEVSNGTALDRVKRALEAGEEQCPSCGADWYW